MGKPLMIQEQDDRRIEQLRKKLGIKTKVQVVRDALSLLEQNVEKRNRVQRWKKAARIVSQTSRKVLSEFTPHSRLHRDD